MIKLAISLLALYGTSAFVSPSVNGATSALSSSRPLVREIGSDVGSNRYERNRFGSNEASFVDRLRPNDRFSDYRYGGRYGSDRWYDSYSYQDRGGSLALRPGVGTNSRESYLQGGARNSWNTYSSEPIGCYLETEGRPLNAHVDFWQGPNNAVGSLKVFSEDGYLRPWQAWLDTAGSYSTSYSTTMDVKNEGPQEFPLIARPTRGQAHQGVGRQGIKVDGGVLRTFSIEPNVESVLVELWSEGLPIKARIELWQGPNNVKQMGEVYVDDGNAKPFAAVLETPGYEGCTVAIRNIGPMEYPMQAAVEPMRMGGGYRSGWSY